MADGYTKPTIDEALHIIVTAPSDRYRRECIAHWRSLYGDGFADQVRAKAHAKIKGKKVPGVRGDV